MRRPLATRFSLSLSLSALEQVVSPGSPTYLYDVCLRSGDVDVRASRPYAAVGYSPSGFTLALAQVPRET
jgi:hypothetical protein